MISQFLKTSAFLLLSTAASAAPLNLFCESKDNSAQIRFDAELINTACRNQSFENPWVAFTIDAGDLVVWEPAPTFLICSKPLQKTMIKFHKSVEEQLYLEIPHDRKTATASFRLQDKNYSMNCRVSQ